MSRRGRRRRPSRDPLNPPELPSDGNEGGGLELESLHVGSDEPLGPSGPGPHGSSTTQAPRADLGVRGASRSGATGFVSLEHDPRRLAVAPATELRELVMRITAERDDLHRFRQLAERERNDLLRHQAALTGHRDELTREIERLRAELEHARRTTEQHAGRAGALDMKLRQLENTRGWRMLHWYRERRLSVLPVLAAPVHATRRLGTNLARGWEEVTHRSLSLIDMLSGAEKQSNIPDVNQAVRVLPMVRIGGVQHHALFCHPLSTVCYRVPAADYRQFAGKVGIIPEHWILNTSGVVFEVGVIEDGAPRALAQVVVAPNRRVRDRRWIPFAVELPDTHETIRQIYLKTSTPPDSDSSYASAIWGDPRLLGGLPMGQATRRLLRAGKRVLQPGGRLRVPTLPRPCEPAMRQELYRQWCARHDAAEVGGEALAPKPELAARSPLISIIVPTYNTPEAWLRRCIDSVLAQTCGNWELCIHDDASPQPRVREVLQEYAQSRRIHVSFGKQNQGITGATNSALALASGEFVALLDHDDELTPDAIERVNLHLAEHPELDYVYSDEDKLDEQGSKCEPFFKPDWSPELATSCMYTCHFSVYRRSVVEFVGGLQPGYDGAQDYDLMLRVTEVTDRIGHIPHVLYHWRKVAGSTASVIDAKGGASSAGQRALEAAVARRGLQATVELGHRPNLFRLRRRVPAGTKVSIVIPTRDGKDVLERCIRSLELHTPKGLYDITIVDNGSVQRSTHEYLARCGHRVLRVDEPFNFSRLNNLGIAQTDGDFVLMLNNDTEIISPDWLDAMLEAALAEGVGAVGAKLLYPNGLVQHGGIVLGIGGIAGHSHKYFDKQSNGNLDALWSIRNYSACTAACLLVRRSVFDQVGGMDEQLAVAFNDVDFCLRILRAGHRIAWTPYAVVIHHESLSRGYDMNPHEIAFMSKRWGRQLQCDPYYNKNLSLRHEDFRVDPMRG